MFAYSIRFGLVAAVFAGGVAPVLASEEASRRAAEDLVQKFIDGPAREAEATTRQQPTEPVRALPTRKRYIPKVREIPERVDAGEAQSQRLQALGERRRKELDLLSERLRKARAAHQQSARDKASEPTPKKRVTQTRQTRIQEQPSGLGGAIAARPDPQPALDEPIAIHKRVTILLVMRPGRRSPRRFARHADPIVCMGSRCYISRGFNADARVLSRRRALGPGNSLGRRSGACRATPLCVFRNVDLDGADALVQPIDIGWLRHDRRSPVRVVGDDTCAIAKGRLSCDEPIETAGYRLWIVPEPVAERAGGAALRRALSTGLRSDLKHAGLATHGTTAQ
ncbi:MAG: OmpH family outer membrane protein [Hyphomicrobiaceae bacterium]